MTRTYACLQLLRLGPLNDRELRAITGWKRNTCNGTVRRLQEQGRVQRHQDGRWEAARA